jgi:hypothetical protein
MSMSAMNISNDSFDATRVELHAIGAGVIPIAVCDGSVYLLLGRERWMASWKGSCRWSGFEGSRKPGECIRETAAREFVEESLGVTIDDTKCALQDRLRDGRYWIRTVLQIHNERHAERYHCTYLIPVPLDASLPSRFLRIRNQLEHIDQIAQEVRYLRSTISFGTDSIGSVTWNDDGTVTCVHIGDTGAPATTTVAEDLVNDVRRWSDARDRLTRAVTKETHASVTVIREWGFVQDVVVNTDYLEKDQVRWWSVAELDGVIAGQGRYETHRFRPYFLPVLQTVLHSVRQMTVEQPEVLETAACSPSAS